MKPKLSRQGSVTYVTLENGKTYKLETVLRQRQAEAVADEARDSATTRALWWRRATRSRDVPNSRASRADLAAAEVREREQTKNLWWRLATRSRDLPRSRAARADLSDNGRAAALIRSIETTYYNMWSDSGQQTNQLSGNQLPTTRQPTTNFYNGRMSKAIAYLCRCQRIKYCSPAHRELSTLLWCVFRNRRTFRRDTLVALHLTRSAYLRRLRTYTALILGGFSP